MQYLSVGESFMRSQDQGVTPENSLLNRLQQERAQKESTRLKRQNK